MMVSILWALIAISIAKFVIAEDIENATIVEPTTAAPKRPLVCCGPSRPCQTIFWPVAIEKGFHSSLTDRYGRSLGSLFRSRLDQGEEECRVAVEKSIRGEIRYRLPSIIGNWTVSRDQTIPTGGQKRADPYATVRVYAFESSFDYYRLLIDKLIKISEIDLAFVDYYSDQNDLADLLSHVIEEDKPWFRIEIEFATATYSLSIDHKKSILNDRFVTAFNKKFRFRLYDDDEDVKKSWYELFDEFGTHYAESGRLGGVYALHGKIDCDQSWAKAFDSLDDLRRCLEYVIGKQGPAVITDKPIASEKAELCENVTRSYTIQGHAEVSGGRERVKERLLSENAIQESFDLLWRDWAQSLREWPSLIGADLKSICYLIEYVLEKEEGVDVSTSHVDKWIKSCTKALESYQEMAQPFTGQVPKDDKGEDDQEKSYQEAKDHSDKRYQFKNQCTDKQRRKRLQELVSGDKAEEGAVILSVRYDNNDSVCVELKKWTEEEKRAFAMCPLLRAEKAAMAASAPGTLPALNVGVIVLIVTGGTLLAIFGVLRTLPAF